MIISVAEVEASTIETISFSIQFTHVASLGPIEK